jgi:hypothetical protein
MGWFCVDDDGNLAKKETHPLLVGHMPVMVAKQPEFKVRTPGRQCLLLQETYLGNATVGPRYYWLRGDGFGSLGNGSWEPTNKAQPLSAWPAAG